MPSVRVAVNGYGTIGKRVADAIARQPDMQLVGVAKTRPSFDAGVANARGYPLYISGDSEISEFQAAKIAVKGRVEEMIRTCDVVIDCAPEKLGKENAQLYRDAGVKAIFQGGEKPNVAEASFNAMANYGACLGRNTLRVVSCNTTGLARAAAVLREKWGVSDWEATIVRRAADPAESDRGPINGILPTFHLPSHHGPDVRTIFPDLSISTTALIVPTTLMHVHVNRVRLDRAPASTEEVREAFRGLPRFHMFQPWERVEGTPQVMEFARDRGGQRPDMMQNVLWDAGMNWDGTSLHFFQAIHQESIVVPESVDAVRAICRLAPDATSSMAITDRTLGLSAPSA
jgi:glyceraldehyde-3-phosphate dehydrogenase (NAD(P))